MASTIFGVTTSSSLRNRLYQTGKATVTISDMPAILVGVTVQIQRSLSPIPTLTDGIVWSAQPVQGTLTAQSIVTTEKTAGLMQRIAGEDNCAPIACTVRFDDNACSNSGLTLSIKDGYCSVVSFAANGNQGYIGHDFTIMFTQCEYSEAGSTTQTTSTT